MAGPPSVLSLSEQVKRLRSAGIGISRGPALLGITRDQWEAEVEQLRYHAIDRALSGLRTGPRGITYRCQCGGRAHEPEGHPGCRTAA